jgi:hypothetical protein
MTIKTPLLEKRTADQIIGAIEKKLEDSVNWEKEEGKPGWAMVRLFGRLAELIVNRLNQLPDKYFLAFLNEAGVDRLAPRAAEAEVTFLPADDGPATIKVPKGTQLATLQTETQPEVIFETEQDLLVIPNALVKCIAFDPIQYSDHTLSAASLTPGTSFAVFEGETDRERILYIGDSTLFLFEDDINRAAATVTLTFALDNSASLENADWQLSWKYWNGSAWDFLRTQKEGTLPRQVEDDTAGLTQSGAVKLSHLPSDLSQTEVGGKSAFWIECQLEKGTMRDHLPQVTSIKGSVSLSFEEEQTGTVDAAFSGLQAGTAFAPLDVTDEFYPLGVRPMRLDTFYLQVDEVFSKQSADATITMASLEGVDINSFPEKGDDSEFGADTSELKAIEIEWAYYGEDGWIRLGISKPTDPSSESILGFSDGTNGFTKKGNIKFTVPGGIVDGEETVGFAKTKVNDAEGYWIRARLLKGSYYVPAYAILHDLPEVAGEATKDYHEVFEAKTYPPFIGKLKVSFDNYHPPGTEARSIEYCCSKVDEAIRHHTDDLAADTVIQPFDADENGPAVYFGFKQAFPAGKWVQLLVDVDEETGSFDDHDKVLWEYSVGVGWASLRSSDGTKGLAERGYLAFFGPEDHGAMTAFDQTAYWLRARYHRAPEARATVSTVPVSYKVEENEYAFKIDASASRTFGDQKIVAYRLWHAPKAAAEIVQDSASSIISLNQKGEAVVTLDAGKSTALNDKSQIVSYRWSYRPVARGQVVYDKPWPDEETEMTFTLDASASSTSPGRSIVRYSLTTDKAGFSKTTEAALPKSPYIRGVRLNTVTAQNSVTVINEVLGASNGKPNQTFQLLKTPVLLDAEIMVQEPDQPPDDELIVLQSELREVDESAETVVSSDTTTPGQGVWVRWHRVSDFYASTPASRHFILDPLSGEIRFGDGTQGKIPPIGIDNIKAARYSIHSGAQGDVDAGTITVVRNPSGDLAEIKSTTNAESAAGGTDAETIERVKRRGPQSLKHRNRAVTYEDFEWLALEASSEVVQARCLPALNADGIVEPGWVTMVITPGSKDEKPTPSASLIRLVERYLEKHALANLPAANHIHVKGPEYIEVTVLAKVVAADPTKADQVELDVLDALKAFLHPLTGGPDGDGWELGRDVYLSEIYTVIESVSGVDYVVDVRLLGSLRQQVVWFEKETLKVENESGEIVSVETYRELPNDIPIDSQVSTFDERIQTLSALPLSARAGDQNLPQMLTQIAIYDFKVGDKVRLVTAGNVTVVENLYIRKVSDDTIVFTESFSLPSEKLSECALMSVDGRLRLPLTTENDSEEEAVDQIKVQGFTTDEKVSIVLGESRHPDLEFLPIEKITTREERIFVPEGYLVYSGDHDVDMVLE